MYAVIASGGKQHRVSEGDIIKLEKLDAEAGAEVSFDNVLMLNDGKTTKIGTPYLDKVTVTAEVLEQGRHKKIHILKFHRRKHHMKQMGHRQDYTEVKITKIGSSAPKTTKAEPKAATAEPKITKTAPKKTATAEPKTTKAAPKKAATTKKVTKKEA